MFSQFNLKYPNVQYLEKQVVVFLSTYLGKLATLYLCPYANATPFEYYKYTLIQWLVQQ